MIDVSDLGQPGAVVQELLTLNKYRDLQLEGRLRGYAFGGMTTLAVRDGKEVRARTKEFMTSLINGSLQRRHMVFPIEDLEIEDQFTTHTYTLHDGRVVDAKGSDHIVDAVRCATANPSNPWADQPGSGGEETVNLAQIVWRRYFARKRCTTASSCSTRSFQTPPNALARCCSMLFARPGVGEPQNSV